MTDTERLEQEIESLKNEIEELKEKLEEVTLKRDDLQECVNEVYQTARYYENK